MRTTGDNAEVIVTKSHDGEIGVVTTIRLEYRRVHNLAHCDIHLAQCCALHDIESRRTGDIEDCKCREVNHACCFTHL